MNTRTTPKSPTTDEVIAFYDYLTTHACGRDNAITARDLTNVLELGPEGPRKCRQMIHAANEADLLICSGNDGYFIPTSSEEARETVGRLRSEAYEMINRAGILDALIDQHFVVGKHFTEEVEQMILIG